MRTIRRPNGASGGGRVARRRTATATALAALVASTVAAAGVPGLAGANGTSHKSASGGVATYAMVTQQFTWILPLLNQNSYEPWDINVLEGSYRPLYFVGAGTSTGIDYAASMADPPVYSNHDRTVTINIKPGFSWSDGSKIDATDVKFFFELEAAGKHTLGAYLPGEMPDDIASIDYPGPDTVVLHLKRSYNPAWFTGNQLTWIYPLPVASWDKTCATCAVGDDASTPAGAKAVFDFLFKQAKQLSTYSTDPLWKTVDGPWVISSYDPTTHAVSFVANTHYTGSTKPHLAGYRIESFTTGTAELDAMRSGGITFGYLPVGDVGEASYFKTHGFHVEPWRLFYNEDMEFGYTSKTWGALFKQLYVRQALQHLVTEKLYIQKALHGYGLPDYGVISDYPGSPYVSPTLRKDPYPYDPSAASKLLTEHGWAKNGAGVDVCKRAGSGPSDCGPGIRKGEQLAFPFVYETDTTSFLEEVSAFQTAAKTVGINITLVGDTQTTMFSIIGVCPTTPPCKYGMAGYWGYMWDYGQYQGVPSGDNQFGSTNYWSGGYSTAKAVKLINAADELGGMHRLYADENWLSKQVASLWWPLQDNIVIVKDTLKGVQLGPYGTLQPAQWSQTP